MRLHAVTWLVILGAMLKLAVLAIAHADLVAAVVYADRLQLIDPGLMLGVITPSMAWNLRDLAQTAALVGAAFWIEALVRIHGRLHYLNRKIPGEKIRA